MSRKFRKARFPVEAVAGVCAGLGYFIGCPVWVVRLIFILLILFAPATIGGSLILGYILLAMFLPTWKENPEDFYDVTGD